MGMNQLDLIRALQEHGVLKTPEIISAFTSIDRADFVPKELLGDAYANAPLPIGHGQTISQPWTVAFMLELLQPRRGQKILDVGSGSGWQTALLAHIVGDTGHVTALERIPALCEQSLAAIDRYGYIRDGIVDVLCADATNGFVDDAPYDRIIAAAMMQDVPTAWMEQLASGGIMVVPMRGSVWKIAKEQNGHVEKEEYPGFAFVPFISFAQ